MGAVLQSTNKCVEAHRQPLQVMLVCADAPSILPHPEEPLPKLPGGVEATTEAALQPPSASDLRVIEGGRRYDRVHRPGYELPGFQHSND
jgi:hypothetical protein